MQKKHGKHDGNLLVSCVRLRNKLLIARRRSDVFVCSDFSSLQRFEWRWSQTLCSQSLSIGPNFILFLLIHQLFHLSWKVKASDFCSPKIKKEKKAVVSTEVYTPHSESCECPTVSPWKHSWCCTRLHSHKWKQLCEEWKKDLRGKCITGARWSAGQEPPSTSCFTAADVWEEGRCFIKQNWHLLMADLVCVSGCFGAWWVIRINPHSCEKNPWTHFYFLRSKTRPEAAAASSSQHLQPLTSRESVWPVDSPCVLFLSATPFCHNPSLLFLLPSLLPSSPQHLHRTLCPSQPLIIFTHQNVDQLHFMRIQNHKFCSGQQPGSRAVSVRSLARISTF